MLLAKKLGIQNKWFYSFEIKYDFLEGIIEFKLTKS